MFSFIVHLLFTFSVLRSHGLTTVDYIILTFIFASCFSLHCRAKKLIKDYNKRKRKTWSLKPKSNQGFIEQKLYCILIKLRWTSNFSPGMQYSLTDALNEVWYIHMVFRPNSFENRLGLWNLVRLQVLISSSKKPSAHKNFSINWVKQAMQTHI